MGLSLRFGLSSDIFSFYKEEVGGEDANYIHDRATVTNKSTYEAILDIVDDVAVRIERVRAVLKDDARDVMEAFLSGYTYWHFSTERYSIKKFMGTEAEEYLIERESK